MIKIGPHISISKGYVNALKEAEKIGATAFQFFSRNPRGGNIKKIDCNDIENIINNKKIKKLPFFLETPNDLEGYKKEIKMIKELKKDE